MFCKKLWASTKVNSDLCDEHSHYNTSIDAHREWTPTLTLESMTWLSSLGIKKLSETLKPPWDSTLKKVFPLTNIHSRVECLPSNLLAHPFLWLGENNLLPLYQVARVFLALSPNQLLPTMFLFKIPSKFSYSTLYG